MILALLRLMRLYYALPMAGGFVVIVAYRLAGNFSAHLHLITLAYFAVSAVIAAGYVLNDTCDLAVDKINCPTRTLPSGLLRPETATIFSIILFLTGLTLALFCNAKFFLTLTGVAAALIFYDIYSKRISFFKDILVAALMTCLYLLAFALTDATPGPRMNSLYISPFWLFFTALGYEMLKDIRDVQGDKKFGPNSIAILSAQPWFAHLAHCLIVAASFITLLPFLLSFCKVIYLCCSITAIILALLSTKKKTTVSIPLIYAQVAIVTFGALADLLILGP